MENRNVSFPIYSTITGKYVGYVEQINYVGGSHWRARAAFIPLEREASTRERAVERFLAALSRHIW